MEFIQEIVNKMFHKLSLAIPHLDNNLVGIDFHLKELEILLSTGSKDVKFVGIYGLGGIGKTTIAKAVYNMISYQFEGCSYLGNVREISKEKKGLVSLQAQLLHNILNVRHEFIHSDMGSETIRNSLSHKRVLVILDDVDHLDQLEKLAGNHGWFGPESRIIITTRDEHLLEAHRVVERYKVKVLAPDASLELFSRKAFKLKYPTDDFVELSRKVVDYAEGLPIALHELGSFFCGRSCKILWNSALDKLKKFPNKEVTNALKISYDGLEDKTYKDIFLDIACFFKGKDKGYVTKILDSCDFYAGSGIPVLIERSLISLSKNNELLMHGLVQDMGRDIVCQESPEDPSKRSRLWLYKDIRYVLKNNYETEAVEAIMLEDWPRPPEAVDLLVSAEAFMKMNNLRFFKIHRGVSVDLPHGLRYLPDKLRVVDWDLYPLEYFPSSFLPENLVELSMKWSFIKQLWDGVKDLENLISIDLSSSENLIELPDLTGAPKLEKLILSKCGKLKCLPSSICRLGYLEGLLLRKCAKLENLPENLGILISLVKLDLSYTAIKESPPSIVRLKKLQSLSFEGCKGTYTRDETFERHRGTDLSDFKLHNFSGLCSLTYLNLSFCSLSDGMIPSDIGSLSSLETLDLSGNNFVSLPFSISQLSRLTTLRLVGCNGIRELPELPSSLATVNANDCTSLERLSKLSVVFKPAKMFFGFGNCYKLDNTSFRDTLQQFQHQALFGNSETFSICLPGSDIPGWFSHQNNEGSSVSIQLPSNWYNGQLRCLAFCIVVHDGPNFKNKRSTFFRSNLSGGIIISKSVSSSAMEIEYTNCDGLENDHVILGYLSRAWLKENEEKSLLEFRFKSINEENIQMEEPCVKTCGIRLIYDGSTFSLMDEDHTIANSVRYILNQDPRVTFCGYRIPHPSEARVNIRVQTTGDPAKEVLKDACQSSMLICQHVRSTFDKSVADFKLRESVKDMDTPQGK